MQIPGHPVGNVTFWRSNHGSGGSATRHSSVSPPVRAALSPCLARSFICGACPLAGTALGPLAAMNRSVHRRRPVREIARVRVRGGETHRVDGARAARRVRDSMTALPSREGIVKYPVRLAVSTRSALTVPGGMGKVAASRASRLADTNPPCPGGALHESTRTRWPRKPTSTRSTSRRCSAWRRRSTSSTRPSRSCAGAGRGACARTLRHRERRVRVGPAPPDEPGGGGRHRRRGPRMGAPAQRRAARTIGVADRAGPRRRAGRGPPRHGRGAGDELQLLGAAHPRRASRLLRQGARRAGRRRRVLPRRLRRVRRVPGDEGDDRERGVHLRLGPGVVRPDHRPQPLPHPLPVPRRLRIRDAFVYEWRLWTLPEIARSWRRRASAT